MKVSLTEVNKLNAEIKIGDILRHSKYGYVFLVLETMYEDDTDENEDDLMLIKGYVLADHIQNIIKGKPNKGKYILKTGEIRHGILSTEVEAWHGKIEIEV